MKLSCKLLFIFILSTTLSFARDRVIFSVSKDIPMGFDNEVIRTNYYVDIGKDQGVLEGTKLDVYRVISKQNPYDNRKRVNYKVKVGILKVLHAEENASIAILDSKRTTPDDPILEVEAFMIGDFVSVNVEK